MRVLTFAHLVAEFRFWPPKRKPSNKPSIVATTPQLTETAPMPQQNPFAATRHARTGASSLTSLVVISLLVLLVLSIFLFGLGRKTAGVADLSIYCAAGMRFPVEKIVQQYKDEFGVMVSVQYGGSNTLLSQLEVAKTGDLFLAADASYIRMAQEKGLAAESISLATMRPVIVVAKTTDTNISSIQDLLQPGLRVACGNPEAAAIGKKTKEQLEQVGLWQALDKQINASGVYKTTVNDVANDVKLGSVDAGIVWDTTAAQYSDLRAIHVPELEPGVVSVEICVLNSTRHPTAALHFARYMAACDRGLLVFSEYNFPVVEGDIWEDVPELTFFVGSVNRRALEPVLKAFQEREGVKLNTVYNGCGILTGEMRVMEKNQDAGFPDTYMACDVYYLETVKDLFQEAVNISDTDIVIAVQKGNPKQIHSINDLLRPGVRVAIGQPEQCTIGALTRRLLQHEGVYDKLLANNVVTQTASSALLIPSVVTKSADATLAYRTDTLSESDKVDVITLDYDNLSKAIQPFSIARSSRQKHLSRRLYQTIRHSRDAFEAAGFHWRLQTPERSESSPSLDNSHLPPPKKNKPSKTDSEKTNSKKVDVPAAGHSTTGAGDSESPASAPSQPARVSATQ